jgi:hypothetical protein
LVWDCIVVGLGGHGSAAVSISKASMQKYN